jgi:hypothetical protein
LTDLSIVNSGENASSTRSRRKCISGTGVDTTLVDSLLKVIQAPLNTSLTGFEPSSALVEAGNSRNGKKRY